MLKLKIYFFSVDRDALPGFYPPYHRSSLQHRGTSNKPNPRENSIHPNPGGTSIQPNPREIRPSQPNPTDTYQHFPHLNIPTRTSVYPSNSPSLDSVFPLNSPSFNSQRSQLVYSLDGYKGTVLKTDSLKDGSIKENNILNWETDSLKIKMAGKSSAIQTNVFLIFISSFFSIR